MPRRATPLTQADIARAIRAAKQAGATSVEVRPDGSIIVMLKKGSVAAAPADPFAQWERQYESEKAARRGERD
jgi:hypothetical protein